MFFNHFLLWLFSCKPWGHKRGAACMHTNTVFLASTHSWFPLWLDLHVIPVYGFGGSVLLPGNISMLIWNNLAFFVSVCHITHFNIQSFCQKNEEKPFMLNELLLQKLLGLQERQKLDTTTVVVWWVINQQAKTYLLFHFTESWVRIQVLQKKQTVKGKLRVKMFKSIQPCMIKSAAKSEPFNSSEKEELEAKMQTSLIKFCANL